MNIVRPAYLIGLTVLLSVVSLQQLPAQHDVALETILSRTGARLQWDPYRQHGALVRGGRMLSFAVGSDRAAENLNTFVSIVPPVRENGSLVFGQDFLELALRLFPPVNQQRRIGAIFIDPGHGGRDPGAIGTFARDGTTISLQEKNVVLEVGLQLRALLQERYPEKSVVLSRDDDTYLTLEERTQLANSIDVEANESVIFVSIHANASLNRRASGFEVWFLPQEFRRRDLVSAEQTGVADPDVLEILNTMREEEITIESILLARNVLTGIESQIGSVSPNRGLREESWYVVRNAKMPSILVEVGFVTNEEEAMRLRDDEYLRRVTGGIYTGIVNFVRSFEELPFE